MRPIGGYSTRAEIPLVACFQVHWEHTEARTSEESLLEVIRPFLIAILPISLWLTRAVLGILLGVVETSEKDACSLVLLSLGRVVQASIVRSGKATAEGRVRYGVLMTIHWLGSDR